MLCSSKYCLYWSFFCKEHHIILIIMQIINRSCWAFCFIFNPQFNPQFLKLQIAATRVPFVSWRWATGYNFQCWWYFLLYGSNPRESWVSWERTEVGGWVGSRVGGQLPRGCPSQGTGGLNKSLLWLGRQIGRNSSPEWTSSNVVFICVWKINTDLPSFPIKRWSCSVSEWHVAKSRNARCIGVSDCCVSFRIFLLPFIKFPFPYIWVSGCLPPPPPPQKRLPQNRTSSERKTKRSVEKIQWFMSAWFYF